VILQILGYAASVIIALSLLMRSIVRLRVINLIGAAMFSAYGFLIHAYPVGVLNFAIAIINIVQLTLLWRRSEMFRILEVAPDTPYVQYFLDVQAEDIRRFFPQFRRELPSNFAIVVLRDLVPAGLLLGKIEGEQLEVNLDYVMPQYRDLKVGSFLFHDEADFFRKRRVREIVGRADSNVHADYLKRMGFAAEGAGTFRLQLR